MFVANQEQLVVSGIQHTFLPSPCCKARTWLSWLSAMDMPVCEAYILSAQTASIRGQPGAASASMRLYYTSRVFVTWRTCEAGVAPDGGPRDVRLLLPLLLLLLHLARSALMLVPKD